MARVKLGFVRVHRFNQGKEARLAETSERRELSLASLAQSDGVTEGRSWHEQMIAEK